jgi:anti-anti-sigma factor
VSFSVAIHHDCDTDLRLHVAGHVLGAVAIDLRQVITEVILVERPDTLLIDLHDVSAIDVRGMHALLTGYVTAIDHGTTYRVVGAHGQAGDFLRGTGAMDVLADSDDVGGSPAGLC